MYFYIKRLNIRYKGICLIERIKKMRCSKHGAYVLIFSQMDTYIPQKPFVRKCLSLLSYCIFFADKFHNMILLYSLKSSYKRTP